MKVINEDIQNLEKYIGNKQVDIHAELPLIMADAYSGSKKNQEEIDKEMEEHNKETEVELNKVLGAEEQPVPDLPVEPKAVLDESLFEDLKEDAYFDFKSDIYNALADVMFKYRDKNIDEIDLDKALNFFADRFFEEEDFFNESLNEDTKLTTSIKNYIDQEHINKNKFINAVLSWYEKDPSFKSMLVANGFYTEEEIEELNEAKKSDEDWDLFGTVEQELVWENPNFKNRTKFPEIPATQRYESEDIGVEYNKDGFVDLTIRRDSKDDFDFANKVAKEYNLEMIGPKADGPDQFKLIFRFPEE